MAFEFHSGSNSELAKRSVSRFWTVSLPEIMVDPVGLLFGEDLADLVVDRLRGGEIAAERLLQHDPGERRDDARSAASRQIGPNRSGEVAR